MPTAVNVSRHIVTIIATVCVLASTAWHVSGAAQSPLDVLARTSLPLAQAPTQSTTQIRGQASPHVLHVCADPNNLPFSNERKEGFENAIATLLARELGRSVEYHWQPQRRGFIRTTLNARRCD